jgi:ABC-type sugar transport system substrate-binding protein
MATLASGLGMGGASAQEIGVTISNFNDNFLTFLREAMSAAAEEKGVTLLFEDSQLDVGKQLSQVQNFVASGLDGIIIAPVDGGSTVAMTQAAEQGGVPVVYTNNLPVNLADLPANQVFVGSLETESGGMQGEEICRQAKAAGLDTATAVILLGDLSNPATSMRTESVKEGMAATGCNVEVLDEQTAKWQREEASSLMTNWMTAGIQPDIVIANNDEMAIGAIQAMKASGISMDDVVVGGIDATQDALLAMAAGELDVTVFQDAAGQGAGALDAALKLARGEAVEQKVYIPFQLVTPANMKEFVTSN